MKNNFVCAVVAAFALIGCTEKDVEPVAEDYADEQEFTLNVSVPVASTKSMANADDDAVDDVQILVFDENGLMEAYGSTVDGTEVSIRCTSGEKSVVAIVNGMNLSTARTRTGLQSMKSNLLYDNTPGHLVMDGEINFTIDGSKTNYDITVPVRRMASKISLGSVTLDFDILHWEDTDFKIESIYLINVAGTRNYISSTGPTAWYNKLGVEDNGKKDLIYDLLPTPAQVTIDAPYTGVHNFYCYPNPAADSSDPEWSPRSTRFVIEATFDGEKCYYPVTMPVIARNKAYTVNLVIKRPGSSSPDEPVQTYWGDSNVIVQDWDEYVIVDKEL